MNKKVLNLMAISKISDKSIELILRELIFSNKDIFELIKKHMPEINTIDKATILKKLQ